jgi:hypothetical protein
MNKIIYDGIVKKIQQSTKNMNKIMYDSIR